MSSGLYTARIESEQERQRRLMEERKRLEEERKRKEQERLRQLEEQKRRQQEAELKKREQDFNLQQQKRYELSRIQANQPNHAKADLSARLYKLSRVIDSRPAESEDKLKLLTEVNKLEQKLENAKEKHLPDLKEKIDKLEEKIHQQEIVGAPPPEIRARTDPKKVKEKFTALKEKIIAFDKDQAKFGQNRIDAILNTLKQVENSLTGNFDFYFSILKNLEAEFVTITREAEQKFQENENQKEHFRTQISRLLARCDAIIEMSGFQPQVQQAIGFRYSLEDLLHQNDLEVLANGFNQFHSLIIELEAQFEDTTTRESDRRYVLQQTQEILQEMGYEVIHTPHNPTTDPYGPLAMNFKAPAGQGVRISLSLANSLHGQFCRLVPQDKDKEKYSPIEQSKLLSQCQAWCRDYEKLIQFLNQRGIHMTRNWHFPADLNQIDETRVPAAMLEEPEPEYQQQYQSLSGVERKSRQ